MNAAAWLWPASAVLGVGHIVSEYAGPVAVRYVLKPAAIACLILLLLLAGDAAPAGYRWLIAAGLAASLVGDVLLIDRSRFVSGLIAFLLAHLLYIGAFGLRLGGPPVWAVLPPLVAYGAAAWWLLRAGLPRELGPPVVVYIVALLVMAWLALSVAIGAGSGGAWLAAWGAMLFCVSDTVLALNRFRWPFHAAMTVILATYYAAQILIALSVVYYVA